MKIKPIKPDDSNTGAKVVPGGDSVDRLVRQLPDRLDANATPRLQQTLALAGKIAKDMGCGWTGTEHVLLAILKLEQGLAWRWLETCGADNYAEAKAFVEETKVYDSIKETDPIKPIEALTEMVAVLRLEMRELQKRVNSSLPNDRRQESMPRTRSAATEGNESR